VITDRRVFDEEYRPRRLLHRDAELDQVLRLFEPAVNQRGAEDLLVSGPSGVGKTALAHHALDRLRNHADVDTAHVHALGRTEGDVLRAILEQHSGAQNPPGNRPADTLQDRLATVVERPLVVVLDEADDVPGTGALGRLTGLPTVSVVAVCHDPQEWRGRLRDADPVRWDGDHHLPLDRYTTGELADILGRRARAGLEPGVIDREQLEQIAEEVAGVARAGVQTLRAAAEWATERGHETIREADVADADERARRRIREANLDSLPWHHQVLYALVHEAGEIRAPDLHDRYDERAPALYEGRPQTPIGKRSRRNKLRKLVDYGLVEQEGQQQHRMYWPADIEVTPSLEVV
jgi:Cdc6-like AAA superfamily ATPase